MDNIGESKWPVQNEIHAQSFHSVFPCLKEKGKVLCNIYPVTFRFHDIYCHQMMQNIVINQWEHGVSDHFKYAARHTLKHASICYKQPLLLLLLLLLLLTSYREIFNHLRGDWIHVLLLWFPQKGIQGPRRPCSWSSLSSLPPWICMYPVWILVFWSPCKPRALCPEFFSYVAMPYHNIVWLGEDNFLMIHCPKDLPPKEQLPFFFCSFSRIIIFMFILTLSFMEWQVHV